MTVEINAAGIKSKETIAEEDQDSVPYEFSEEEIPIHQQKKSAIGTYPMGL
jgi:hypothetical protein